MNLVSDGPVVRCCGGLMTLFVVFLVSFLIFGLWFFYNCFCFVFLFLCGFVFFVVLWFGTLKSR